MRALAFAVGFAVFIGAACYVLDVNPGALLEGGAVGLHRELVSRRLVQP